MNLEELVYSVLVVSDSEKFNTSLRKVLPRAEFSFADSVGKANRKMLDKTYDFVIVNSPLKDDFGKRIAIDVSSKGETVALLFVSNEIYDEVYSEVTPYGVLTVAKPTTNQSVVQSYSFMRAIRERLRRMQKKTASVEEKMTEIRVVNRAKWILIDELKISEQDAHRYIEKQAMNRCISKKEFADEIIKRYS